MDGYELLFLACGGPHRMYLNDWRGHPSSLCSAVKHLDIRGWMTDQQLCFLSFRHRVIFIETTVSLFGGLAHKKPCSGEGKKGKRKGCRRRACVTTGRFSCDEILMPLTLILQWVLLIQICRGRGDTLPPSLFFLRCIASLFAFEKCHPPSATFDQMCRLWRGTYRDQCCVYTGSADTVGL